MPITGDEVEGPDLMLSSHTVIFSTCPDPEDAKQWFKPTDKRMISIADDVYLLFILLLI